MTGIDIYSVALECISASDPQEKCDRTARAVGLLGSSELCVDTNTSPEPIGIPGRPDKPRLVSPRDLPRRRLGSQEGRATLLHALAHIEFNAINLAWDAVYRFRELPQAYYRDWAKVAGEEAYHFSLLCERLQMLGYVYGDFDAHDGLWEMACRTAHDPLVRMALVPRVLEARGLDVSPGLIDRLGKAGDSQSVELLRIILRDEIGHVGIGSHWFRYLCEQRQLEPVETFNRLLIEYMKGHVKGPFYYEARYKAGFDEAEMRDLEELAAADK